MTTYLRSIFPVAILAVLSACASTPELTTEQIYDQYPSVADLDQSLQEAAAQNVDMLAPEGYASARDSLDEALEAARGDKRDRAQSAAQNGAQALDKARQDAELTRDLLGEVLEARGRAQDAGARSLYPDNMDDLDSDLRRTANLIERGKREDAKQRRPNLLAGYEQLELAALKEGMVDAAKAALENARENEAPKLAPKTFKLAEEEMALALSILDADRTKTDKANVHAERAKWLADKSTAIAELIKDFDRRDFTREDVLLWYQQQLTEINDPLGEELPFNERNRNVVEAMRAAIQSLKHQRDATAAARSQYEQELSMTAEQRQAVDKVQSLFSAEQANVYQQRRNVLISAHGFEFPPGGSELESKNFSLMNKIIEAIRTFPDSRINISGHTDSTGSATINQTLSERRATNVAQFLTDVGGIDAQRITVNGYGSARPVASNETAQGRAANRRVEILIINR